MDWNNGFNSSFFVGFPNNPNLNVSGNFGCKFFFWWLPFSAKAVLIYRLTCRRELKSSWFYVNENLSSISIQGLTLHRMLSNLVLIYFSYYGARGRKSLISPCQIFPGIVKWDKTRPNCIFWFPDDAGQSSGRGWPHFTK